MEYIGKEMEKYVPYSPDEYREYVEFIKFILKNADEIGFVVNPFFDNLDELENSVWPDLRENVLYTTIARAITERSEVRNHYIVLKNDYAVYDFFLHKKNMSDFGRNASKSDMTLEDPLFMKNGEIICYTLTHEDACYVEEGMYWEFRNKFERG